MRELQTSTLSNQNISADLLAATYTADADRAVIIDVVLDQVAGGGDYAAYVTKQKLGAGSFYKSPLSYNSAAAGVTSVWFTGLILAVKNTDVIKVYVKGLAGDTATPDVTVSVCELSYLRPTVAGRTLDIAATGEAGLDFDNVHDAASAHALANVSVPEIWNALTAAFATDGSVGKLLKDYLNAAVGSIPTTPLLTDDARLPATVIAAKADVPTVAQVQNGLATAAGVGSPLQTDDERLPETIIAAKADVPTVAQVQSGLATAEGVGSPLQSDDERLPATVLAAKADVPTVAQVQNGLATAVGVGSPLQTDDERLPETVIAAKADVPTVAQVQSGLATAAGVGSPLQSDDERLPETILAAKADVPTVAQVQSGLATAAGMGNPLQTDDERLPATVLAAKADIPTVAQVQNGLATAAGVGSPLQSDDERLPETVIAAKADVPTVAQVQSGLATATAVASIPTNPLLTNDERLPETSLAAAADVPSPAAIDAQLSGVHGSGRWGAGNGGAASITDVITDDVTELPVADVIVTLYSDVLRANALDQQVTDESGAYTFTNLIAGTYYLRASKAGEYRNEDFTKVAA